MKKRSNYVKKRSNYVKKGDRLCPECICDRWRIVLKKTEVIPAKTDTWYESELTYWRCPQCRQKFVSRPNQVPELTSA